MLYSLAAHVLATFSAIRAFALRGTERTGRRRKRKRTLPRGKTMIGRRSLETCLLGPGKCTTKGVLDLHGARPRSARRNACRAAHSFY